MEGATLVSSFVLQDRAEVVPEVANQLMQPQNNPHEVVCVICLDPILMDADESTIAHTVCNHF